MASELELLNEAGEIVVEAISRMRAAHVACLDLTTRAEAFLRALNTRPAPAATDTGLVTVEHQYWRDQTQEWLPTGFPDRYRKDGFQVRELVTRSQAERLISAKDVLLDIAKQWARDQEDRANRLQADNAAKDARLEASEKEVDRLQTARVFDGWLYHNPDTGTEWAEQHPIVSGEVPDATEVRAATATAFQNELIPAWGNLAKETSRRKALEAKLAAAEKALEPFAKDAAKAEGLNPNNSIAHVTAARVRDLRKARAVLAGKPS